LKKKDLYIDIPKLLRRQTIDHLMLGYVLGYRNISPIKILQVRPAIKAFIEDIGCSEDEYPLDSALCNFYSLLDEYREWVEKDDIKQQRRHRNDKSSK
jgi:hypothetical protein